MVLLTVTDNEELSMTRQLLKSEFFKEKGDSRNCLMKKKAINTMKQSF
jgi:hypothetical protein